jgi:hypothetical protein
MADFVGLQETMKKNIQTKFLELLTPTDHMAGTGCPQKADLGGSYVVLSWKDLI